MSWPTFGEHVARLAAALEAHPEWSTLPAVSTTDQCDHSEPSGGYLQALDGWPREYCLDEALPAGTTHFVSV